MEEVEKKFYDFSLVCRNSDKETLTPVHATVKGSIPDYALGTYLFNGPGLCKIGDAEYKHAFDSAAMLQKIRVSREGCWYSSRHLQTETLARNRSANTITVAEFGTGAVGGGTKGLFAKMRQLTDTEKLVSDNASVNVVKIAGRVYAMGETPYQHEIDPDTMEIKKKVSLYRELSLITQCGHPVSDEEGNTLTVAQSIGLTGPKYAIVLFPKDGGAPSVVARVSPRWRLSPCYMHSVGITKNYMVLLEQPLAVSIKDAMTDVFNSTPFMDCIKWHEESVFIHVLDMRTWKLVKTRYVLSTCFMLHFANCYEEEDGRIFMDFPSYNDSKMLRFMFIDQLKAVNGDNVHEACGLFNNCLKRVVLPSPATETGAEVSVTAETLTDATGGVENPIVNPLYRRRRHRYVYGSGHSPSGHNHGRICKIDVESKEVIAFFEEDLYFCEVIFVNKPGSEAEDDGLLVCFAGFSSMSKHGCLVLLDTRALKEVARISFTAVADVPMPLHGLFLPADPAAGALNSQ